MVDHPKKIEDAVRRAPVIAMPVDVILIFCCGGEKLRKAYPNVTIAPALVLLLL